MYENPHIISIQETKIQQHKSTNYIDKKLQNYKVIYNISNNMTCKHNRYTGPTMARGGILDLISKSIYTNIIINKIRTPSLILPDLRAILITNNPLSQYYY